MPYGRRRSYRSRSYGRYRAPARRSYRGRRRVARGRSRAPQKIVIQVVGGPAGGSVPISTAHIGSMGRRPLRAKY